MKSRRRHRHPHVNHERWLVSYADFITLLFAFFVVMYSVAEVNKRKVGQLAAAIQTAFQQMGAFPGGAQAPALPPEFAENLPPPPEAKPLPVEQNGDLTVLRKELEQALSAEIARGEVSLETGPDGLVVSLREGGFFDSGSAGVKTASQPAFSRMAALLGERQYDIRIEGHTDNVPIHNSQFTSNWELSTARATEIIRLLVTKYGFPPAHLSAAGYGEYHPVASNTTEEGRGKNRRVDVVILRQAASGKPSAGHAAPESPAP